MEGMNLPGIIRYWPLLRRRGHIYCIPGLGILQGRVVHDPHRNHLKASDRVQLSGVRFPDEPAILRDILSPHLFPGGQGRIADAKWYLPPAQYPVSAHRCGDLGSSW